MAGIFLKCEDEAIWAPVNLAHCSPMKQNVKEKIALMTFPGDTDKFFRGVSIKSGIKM